jgi:hypothetical protein
MYKPGGTIADALANIDQKNWVLPAIQREFVWKTHQITGFFDSLMRGFPFGTFLFWTVRSDQSHNWKFYDFVREFHERDQRHCPELGSINNRAVAAVLDGQQRLTALNIGLRGSMALKRKYARKASSDAYPVWHLYLNLLSRKAVVDAPEGELENQRYDFRFMEDERPYEPGVECWFRVDRALGLQSGPSMLKLLTDMGLEGDDLNVAFAALDRLHNAVHVDPTIHYYEEASPDLQRVLNIFIRLNSAGTLLSQADLLHSIIVSQWKGSDARRDIAALVDEMNRVGAGFTFTTNFVLKASLMLSEIASVGFRVENFTRPNVEIVECHWKEIKSALLLTAALASNFGLNWRNLKAVSSLLPIAYYLYKIGSPEAYLHHTKFAADRAEVRRWLIASLLKPSGVWGSGLDTLLTHLRTVIRDNYESGFPASDLRDVMAGRGKSLSFDDREIDGLLNLEYSQPNTFLALTLLYPFVDLRNQYHVDHIYPESKLRWQALRKLELSPDDESWISARRNRLPNLQLLNGPENNEKRALLPGEWLQKRFPDAAAQAHYCAEHDIGRDAAAGLSGFRDFYTVRSEKLRAKLKAILNQPHLVHEPATGDPAAS